ncbi:MAG: prepilin peptidase [Blastocatellia bacterium]
MIGQLIVNLILLTPLAAVITYYDVKYRRIPNVLVLTALLSGLAINVIVGGWTGLFRSLSGCVIAFGLMLLLHVFGALGAGDVKLFAAIGAVIGAQMVLPTFLVILITGGAMAVLATLRTGTMRETSERVALIFYNLLIRWTVPTVVIPEDRKQTIPYGVAITFGSLLSLAIFRS